KMGIGKEENFRSIVNLVKRRAHFNKDELGEEIEETDVPADLKTTFDKARQAMLEMVAENDETFLEEFYSGSYTVEQIQAAIRRTTLSFKLVPVFLGSAFKNKGVQLLLDGVLDYLPSPLDVPAIEGTNTDTDEKFPITSDPNGPFYALVFKIMADPFVGVLNFVRVYSGELKAGSYVY